ncbi:uroporphyrinogen decarboxylase/cobalamine-independent methonine synthase family protein [Williamsia deligens]|uniref:Vitamin-B12 independent methionine synthase n=1 Tax=Williamsia deligens TaxID=321325 RepID=A0ABW3G3S6_9NOCA|nr:vitamin-B12 independent methionine synthase [Williamsia deligens]
MSPTAATPAGPPTGIATGVGSMPGVDPRAAADVVAGEVALMHLPELPDRGPGADMIGRCAALLVDMPMDIGNHGYRFAGGGSALGRRARDMLRADLDALEEVWETRGLGGPDSWVKMQVCGPFTAAAGIELANGHKVVADRGAWGDVVGSLTEGIVTQVRELTRRLGARVVVQLDEPSLDRVIDGTVRPLSRFDTVPAIPAAVVAEHLSGLCDAVATPVVLHHCGQTFPWAVVAQTPLWGVSLDLTPRGDGRLPTADLDGLGETIESGVAVMAGVVPGVGPATLPSSDAVADRVVGIVDTIGLDHSALTGSFLVTPSCGLSGATGDRAAAALALCTSAAAQLPHR